MPEVYYGKEPCDLRLIILRLLQNLKMIVAITTLGTIVFGGSYYVKNIVFVSEKYYTATSSYYVEYGIDPQVGNQYTYINGVSWDNWIKTEEFLSEISGFMKSEVGEEELKQYLSAALPSDLRMPTTTVTTTDPDLSVEIAEAVEQSFILFADKQKEIDGIRVVDSAREAKLIVPDVRPIRAFVLGGMLSFLFVLGIYLLKIIGDDSIWLPITISRRYGLKTVGTENSKELKENLQYFFQGKRKIAVTSVTQQADAVSITKSIAKLCQSEEIENGTIDIVVENNKSREWIPVPSPILCPEVVKNLREADGILLVVQAGSHAGKQLEFMIEYLRQQDCKITCVILSGANEKLIQYYYGFSIS